MGTYYCCKQIIPRCNNSYLKSMGRPKSNKELTSLAPPEKLTAYLVMIAFSLCQFNVKHYNFVKFTCSSCIPYFSNTTNYVPISFLLLHTYILTYIHTYIIFDVIMSVQYK